MTADKTQLVIDIVHGIDALEVERARLVEPIDAKIAQARADLATLMGGTMPRVTPTPGRQRGTGQKLRELIAATPDAPVGIRALQVYGEDTPDNRARLRCLLRNLRREGKVRKGEDGQWEVSDPRAPSPGTPPGPT